MTLIPHFKGDEPICEKHNYIGYNCPQCYITIERDHYINTLEVLRSMFNKAKLDAGIAKCDELINNAKPKP